MALVPRADDSNVPYYRNPTNGLIYAGGGDDVNCTLSVCPVELTVYGYRPTLPGSITLIVLYALCMMIQIGLGVRYRAWTYMSAMVLGCLDEILGYVGRILYYHNPWGQTGFIMQIVLITIGPVFFSAAIYVMIAKIVTYISVSVSRFDPKWFYYFFIPFDIISLILQAAGGAISSTSNGGDSSGVNIALAGLSIQVITLFVFTVLCIDYAIRSRSLWTAQTLSTSFKIMVPFLTLATILIFIRCCYRIYELHQGYDRNSTALRDEKLFNALEAS
ncbi:uncharacterized protein KY384_006199 [Bacidia gigantensis]|uniref:uncharacterized protein n=1 Tax=Bacidia gigantensis TaxID=2732470 RepID=UPI001D04D976|nr:uncharacterized protein KY384_006199 [Bacidia gigantensis]KAG8529562.1 hypothetical protein KY384_006199 [Bacidia gigantensis]